MFLVIVAFLITVTFFCDGCTVTLTTFEASTLGCSTLGVSTLGGSEPLIQL